MLHFRYIYNYITKRADVQNSSYRWRYTTAGVLPRADVHACYRLDDVTTIQSYCTDRKFSCHHHIASSPDRRSQLDIESRVLLFVTRDRDWCRSQKILSWRSHKPRILSSTTPNNVTTSRCQLVWTECKVSMEWERHVWKTFLVFLWNQNVEWMTK